MIRKVSTFLLVSLFVCPVLVFAETYSVDTVALQEALNEITTVGQDKNIDEAKADFAFYFYRNAGKEIPVDEIVDKCIEFVGNNVSCMNFIRVYNSYLDHANFCFKANHFERPVFQGEQYSFEMCYLKVDRRNLEEDGSTTASPYGGGSLVDQCTRWVRAAERCSSYLQQFYAQKLETNDLSTRDKRKYRCLLEKVQTGHMTIPTSDMEKECK